MDDDATKEGNQRRSCMGASLVPPALVSTRQLALCHGPKQSVRFEFTTAMDQVIHLSVRVEQKRLREESRPQTQLQLPQLRHQGFVQLDFFSFRKGLHIFAIR